MPVLVKPPILILGAGPVGLLAALHARRLGATVRILTDQLTDAIGPHHIECVPARTIALLVEFGIDPRTLGVDRLNGERHSQWEHAVPTTTPSPKVANISRPALDTALLEMVRRQGIEVAVAGSDRSPVTERDSDSSILDATGRAARSAGSRHRTAARLTSRTFFLPEGTVFPPEFAIAAGSLGYAYRLGNRQGSCIGVVGSGDFVAGSWRDVLARVSGYAPWLVSDLNGKDVVAGKAGPSFTQWATRGPRAILIGDAELAYDALSSQGLAIGLSGALHAVSSIVLGTTAGPPRDTVSARRSHAHRISGMIESAPFASHPEWSDYRKFLLQTAVANPDWTQ